jgi:hypothetical protein
VEEKRKKKRRFQTRKYDTASRHIPWTSERIAGQTKESQSNIKTSINNAWNPKSTRESRIASRRRRPPNPMDTEGKEEKKGTKHR